MRITPGMTDRSFLANVSNLNEMLENASQQVSTGKKLLHLKDSPSGAAEVLNLRNELAQIDQYRSNSDSVSFYIGVADSALTSVHNLMTSIFTLGSSAASSSVDPNSRASVAKEIRSLRDQVLSLANTEARGRFIFSGSRVTTQAFTLAGDLATYNGDTEINKINVAAGLDIKLGVAGSDVFTPVFNTIAGLLSALDGNDLPAIQTALTQFSSTLSTISQTRGQLGMDMSRLQGLKNDQDSQELSVQTRRSQIEDVNMAQAITQMDQAQTALQATLTTQVTVQRRNLFDILG